MRVLLAVLLVLSFSTDAGRGALPDARDIVRRHIEAIGGSERWHRVQSLLIKGTGTFGTFVWLWKSPDKVRTEEHDTVYSGKTLVTAFDGATAWTSNPFRGPAAPRRLSADEQRRWETGLTIRSDLLDLPDKGVELALVGHEAVGGREAYKLSLRREERDEVLLWIDMQSFLIVQRARRLNVPWGGGEKLVPTPVSDYRSIDGLLIPHAFGGTKCVVEINPQVSDALFALPNTAQ